MSELKGFKKHQYEMSKLGIKVFNFLFRLIIIIKDQLKY